MIKATQCKYYLDVITDKKNNTKVLFNIANTLLGKNDPLPQPPTQDHKTLAEEFNKFFKDKIAKIMDNLRLTRPTDVNPEYIESEPLTSQVLNEFKHVDETELMEIIKKTLPKFCELDPLPTSVLLTHSDALLPTLTDIVNTSLDTSEFAENLKQTILQPLLQKLGLPLILQNYRPVLNLSYIPKLIERVACTQLKDFAKTSSNLEPLQSAYRAAHSTETAMLKVKMDMFNAIEDKKVMCLVLLDLSTAFDSVNHNLLLNHLKHHFGMKGKIIAWLSNYLQSHTQKVVLNNTVERVESELVILEQGVPQCSVLGLVLFSLYIAPLGDICRRHGILYHLYADDQQIYFSFKPAHMRGKQAYIGAQWRPVYKKSVFGCE